MNRITALLATALLLGLATTTHAQTPAEKVQAELRSWSMVLDVLHQPGMAVEWMVGVLDDGTKRWGLASSVCNTLHEHKAVGDRTIVRIVDLPALQRNGGDFRAASLGSVDCNTWEQLDP